MIKLQFTLYVPETSSMGTNSASLSTEDDHDQHEQQGVHPYLVSLAIGVTAVVLVLVISVLCFCLLLLKTRGKKRKQGEEILRKADVEDPSPDVCESLFPVTCVKPKPSPSIFNKDEFLLEELEMISNIHIHVHEDNVGELEKSELTYDRFTLGDVELHADYTANQINTNTSSNFDMVNIMEEKDIRETLVCTMFEARNGFSWLYFP